MRKILVVEPWLKWIAVNVIALALTPSFLLCTTQAKTQADIKPPGTPERIAGELRAIESAAARHATDDELGKLWEQLASNYLHEMDLSRAEEAYDRALKLLRGSETAWRKASTKMPRRKHQWRLKEC